MPLSLVPVTPRTQAARKKSGAEPGKDPDQEFGPRHIPPPTAVTSPHQAGLTTELAPHPLRILFLGEVRT